MTSNKSDRKFDNVQQLSFLPDHDRFCQFNAEELSEIEEKTIINLAKAVIKKRYQPGKEISDPKEMKDYLRLMLFDRESEHFGLVFMDIRHRIISYEELFHGTINGASVHPRVVVKRALAVNCAAVILCHNHPSGVADPSDADINLTRHIKDALDLVDVRVLDHIIVGEIEIYSFAEMGKL